MGLNIHESIHENKLAGAFERNGEISHFFTSFFKKVFTLFSKKKFQSY